MRKSSNNLVSVWLVPVGRGSPSPPFPDSGHLLHPPREAESIPTAASTDLNPRVIVQFGKKMFSIVRQKVFNGGSAATALGQTLQRIRPAVAAARGYSSAAKE
ncbi:hypothetical protein CRG98_021758, partial [Punica granatum]